MISTVLANPGEIVLDDLLAGFPHPAAVLDASFRIVALNPMFASLTGYIESMVSGIYVDFILRSNIGSNHGQIFRQVAKSGEPATRDGNIINRLRKKIAVRFTISPLRTGRQKQPGLLLVVEDLAAIQGTAQTRLRSDWTIGIIGHSRKMQAIFDILPLMSRTDTSILITGETGTGKDRIAESIHRNSSRGKHQFIKINCGALPPDLLESELFGHVKGAFTGAFRDKPGMFKLADKGTVFLTEIGDMPLPLQTRLLSVLDDRAFYPVGGETKEHVDVRIIAATHRSLKDQVEQGAFREDLFYRINVLTIHLPSLRERDGDIRFLLDFFLQDYAKRLNKAIQTFSDDALEHLLHHPYPGNIRELRNIVEYCANVCRESVISKDDLPRYIFEQLPTDHPAIPVNSIVPTRDRQSPAPELPRVAVPGSNWTAMEREMILQVLKTTHGNRSKAAAILGWGRTTLWRKIAQHGLA